MSEGTERAWWLLPLVIGVVVAVALLLLGEFLPTVDRYYSVL